MTKKIKIFFLTISILSVIIGASGSAFYFKQIQLLARERIVQNYQIKQKTVINTIHLNLLGSVDYNIKTAKTDHVSTSIEYATNRLVTNPLKISEQEHELFIEATPQVMDDYLNPNVPNFITHLIPTPIITITIPENSTNLTITGKSTGHVLLNDLKTKNLTSNFKNATIRANNLVADQTKLISQTGNIFINQSNNQLNINTKSGNIYLSDSQGEINITTESGVTSLSHNKSFDKVKVTSITGDIVGYLDPIDETSFIKTSSKTGDIQLFDENHTLFRQEKKTKEWELISQSGDIIIKKFSE